jgi:FkbM family methyltransferase
VQKLLIRLLILVPDFFKLVGIKVFIRIGLSLLFGKSKVRFNFRGHILGLRATKSDFQVFHSIYGGLEFDYIRSFIGKYTDRKILIVDAGAFIGISTRYFSELGSNIHVEAFEPSPTNFEMLVTNTKNMSNVVIHNRALTSHGLDVSVYDRGTGPWGHSLISNSDGVSFDELAVVNSSKLTDVLAGYEGWLKILKLDIEGGELDLLSHADRWMDGFDLVVAELHPQISPQIPRLWYEATSGMKLIHLTTEKVCAVREWNSGET